MNRFGEIMSIKKTGSDGFRVSFSLGKDNASKGNVLRIKELQKASSGIPSYAILFDDGSFLELIGTDFEIVWSGIN